MRKPFDQQVLKRLDAIYARQVTVMRESAQRLVALAQTPVGAGGNLPVRDGFLRASLVATTGPMPATRAKPKDGVPYAYNGGVSLAIANWDPKTRLTAAYTANYARHVHYGTQGRPGRPWVHLAAQRWPQIVREVIAEVRGRTQ